MRRTSSEMKTLAVGDRVTFKAAGKVARLEGMSGKWIPGTIKAEPRVDSFSNSNELWVSILADHRKVKGSSFEGMGSLVPVKNVRKSEGAER